MLIRLVVLRVSTRIFVFMKYGSMHYTFGFSFVVITFTWLKDVIRESDLEINHGYLRNSFFKIGIILFIRSEAIFSVSLPWRHSDFATVVDFELGVWPPKGLSRISPSRVPLSNTLILLSSGVFITWRHFRVLSNNWFMRLVSLIITLPLGVYLLTTQYEEHGEASYSFIIRGYGRIFFLATGSHGFHVTPGCMIIFVRCVRILLAKSDGVRHYNFEFSAWYWHFVDVVWSSLYTFIYRRGYPCGGS